MPSGGVESLFGALSGQGLNGLVRRLGLSRLDCGDLLLLLVLLLLWKEDQADPILLLTLAAAFLLED